jgi:hypothetical protein
VIEQEELYDKVEDLQGDQDQGMQDDTLSKTASISRCALRLVEAL